MRFIDSLRKIDRRLFKTAGYDLLHYLTVMLIIVSTIAVLDSMVGSIQSVQETSQEIAGYVASNEKLPAMTEQLEKKLEQETGKVKLFFVKATVLLLSCYLLLVAASGFFRGLVYSKKAEISTIKRFLKGNSIWLLAWTMLFAISIFVLDKSILMISLAIEIYLYLHLSAIFRTSLVESSISDSFKKVSSKGLRLIHRFLLPSLAISAAFVAAMQVLWLDNIFPFALVMGLGYALVLVWLSWARSYYVEVIRSL